MTASEAAAAGRRLVLVSGPPGPVHLDNERAADPDLFARSAQPVGLGPVVTVDTTRPVGIAALAAQVRSRLR